MLNVRHPMGSIKTRISLLLVVIVTGLLAMVELYQYSVERRAVEREIVDLADRTMMRLIENLEFPLWEVDSVWVAKVIDTEMLDRNVQAIFVEGEGGVNLARVRSAQVNDESAYLTREQAIFHDGNRIGKVRLDVTGKYLLARLRQETINALTVTLIIGVMIILTLFFLLSRSVIEPLREIYKNTMAIAEGDYSRDLDSQKDDEIGGLAVGVNLMKENIRRREEELRASEQRYMDLYNSSPDMYVSVEVKTAQVIECNQTLLNVLGYHRDEVIGTPLLALYHPDCMDEARRVFQGFMETGRVRDAELILQRKDRSKLHVSLNVSAVHNKQGAIQFSRSTLRDITERKRIELSLQQANENLARFAVVASHHLQEPLRLVASYTQLLRQRYHGRLDADADEYIDYAGNGAIRMQRLIDDLLAYSSLGSLSAAAELVNSREVVNEVIHANRQRIEALNARIEVGDLPEMRIQRRHLLMLIQYLLDNALNFSVGASPVQVWIDGEQRDNMWRFSVRDNGPGIAPRHRERIFRLFERLEHGRHDEGTGVGLAMCRKLVELYGGRIWVEGREGEGSTFIFVLPVSD